MASIINALSSGAGGLVSSGDTSGVLQLQNNSSASVTLDASGNVGIGTTAPRSLLDVVSGTANTAGDSVGALTVTGAAPNYGVAGYGTLTVQSNDAMAIDKGGGIAFGARTTTASTAGVQVAGITGAKENGTSGNTAGYLGFYTRTAGAGISERMRIDSSGNLLVGVSSIPFNTAKLFVGTAATRGCYLYSTSSGDVATEQLRIGKYDNNTTTSQIFVKFTVNNDSNGSGQINANGASSCAFGSYSDISLKENIEPLPSQLNNIMALKPSEFDYKDGSGHQIGFIAQEMQEVYPDVVSPDENGLLMVTGWSKTEARLVKAIQEQQTLIVSQSELINSLTARVTALENA